MPKFKAGDIIVPMDVPTKYDRIVIGTTSHGHVVYEYSYEGDVMVGSAHENKMKLKPTKKEGWVNIWKHTDPTTAGRVYASKEEARAGISGDTRLIATIKIEWEE